MGAALEISATITPEDRAEAVMANIRPLHARRRWRGLVLGVVALLAALPVGLFLASPSGVTGSGVLRLAAATLAQPVVAGWFLFSAVFVLARFLFHDRLALRRVRRWTAAEHGSDPVPLTYRFDEAGCTATDPYSRVRIRWDAFAALEETPRAFRLMGKPGTGISLLLPRRALAPEKEQSLRSLVADRIGAASANPAPMAVELPAEEFPKAEVSVRYDEAAEDRVAALLVAWDTGRTRRMRWLYALAVAIGGSLLMPGIAMLDWLFDTRSTLRAYPLLDILADSSGLIRNWCLFSIVGGMLIWALWPTLLRRQARAVGRLVTERRSVRFALGQDGITTAVPEAIWHYDWTAVLRYAEGPQHLLFVLRNGQVFPLPRRALDDAALGVVRRITGLHTAATSKGT